MEYDTNKPTVWAKKGPDRRLFFFAKEVSCQVTEGWVHSLESMGLVDGPGIRTAVFLQGCALRCQYCHNPDTWQRESTTAQPMTPAQLLRRLERFRPYYGEQGGVTFSGGEPLLQPDFLRESLKLCRRAGIHTCLDTAGRGLGDYGEILAYTDLVLLDVKHYTSEGFRQVTGGDMEPFLHFVEAVRQAKVPLWVRHVVVPGLTDGEEHLEGLEEYLRTLPRVERVELLPYHTLGVHKYEALGIPYPLEGVSAMEKEVLRPWEDRLNRHCTQGLDKERKRKDEH